MKECYEGKRSSPDASVKPYVACMQLTNEKAGATLKIRFPTRTGD